MCSKITKRKKQKLLLKDALTLWPSLTSMVITGTAQACNQHQINKTNNISTTFVIAITF